MGRIYFRKVWQWIASVLTFHQVPGEHQPSITDSIPENRPSQKPLPDATMLTIPSSHVIGASTESGATVTAADVFERQIFALLVGINKYSSNEIPELFGCVNDCNSMYHFLTTFLCVPQSHIIVLTDESATRHAILSSFENHFVQNSRIKKGDAMVFYYAGHGSRVKAPSGWLADDNMIETICPCDERTRDANDNFIYGIPDRTIDGLMRRLAFHKGDNITAIFDSCHSGGISRIPDVVRFLPPSPSTPPFPDNLDHDVWAWGLSSRTAHAALPLGFLYQAMSSHVLLAACRQEEVALEAVSTKNDPCGAFSNSLIHALEDCIISETTYSALVERLQQSLHHQHPQCEGTNKDRVLFNVSDVRARSRSFKVFRDRNTYYVAAGSIHGIVIGTQFMTPSPDGFCVLTAVAVYAHRCAVMHEPHQIPDGARATVFKWNDPKLNVYFHQPAGNLFSVVHDTDRADVAVLRRGGNQLFLERFDPLIRKYSTGLVSLKHENISEVLDSVAHFNSHLYRRNERSPLNGLITVRLHRLKKQQSSHFLPEYGPTGDDLFSCDPEPIVDDARGRFEVTEIKEAVLPDDRSLYGLTLENHSELALFPYVFYFDPASYSIQPWYLPPSATMSPPLSRRKAEDEPSKLPVGYGASGTDALRFSLPPGIKVDSGFLKVFVSSAYVDMSVLQQDSPINKPPRHAKTVALPFNDVWDAWTFVVTVMAKID